MSNMKIVAILLVLLLTAMVPFVSACEGSVGCDPDTKTTQLYQTPEIDLFAQFGVEKPSPSEGPQWQTYDSSKQLVDDILEKSGKQSEAKRVIGYLKGDSENVVLLKGADGNHYALLEKNGKIKMQSVNVTVLGTFQKQDVGDTSPDIALDAMKNPVSSTSYELRKLSLSEIGSSEFGTKSVYETHILRTDSWVSALDPNKRADLYTEGIFTYDYGVQILAIEDYTFSQQDLGIDRCDFSHSTRITSSKGYVDSYVIWALMMAMPPKHSVDAWISCSTTGVTGGYSQVSEWVSTGFGCFGTP